MKVAVLMATYNGADYLEEQVKSILLQDYPVSALFIRDDGSTDQTREILKGLAASADCIHILPDHHNLGVSANFMTLLKEAGDGFDAYAFADQDDVWQPYKVRRAVEHLQKEAAEKPLLYFSRLAVTDAQLQIRGHSPIPTRFGFWNAISQNLVTGCTAALNASARKLILKTPAAMPGLWIHDWWIYLVVSYFGKTIYDPEATILYRQHEKNVVGAKPGAIQQVLHRLRTLSDEKLEKRRPSRLIEIFLKIYGDDIRPEDKAFLLRIIDRHRSFAQRFLDTINPRWQRQSTWDTFALRMRYLSGRY